VRTPSGMTEIVGCPLCSKQLEAGMLSLHLVQIHSVAEERALGLVLAGSPSGAATQGSAQHVQPAASPIAPPLENTTNQAEIERRDEAWREGKSVDPESAVAQIAPRASSSKSAPGSLAAIGRSVLVGAMLGAGLGLLAPVLNKPEIGYWGMKLVLVIGYTFWGATIGLGTGLILSAVRKMRRK